PDELHELREGAQVGDGGDLAPECRNLDEPASAPARVGERGGVRLPERRRQQALVAGGVERHARRDRVLRGAAPGEPRDRVQDAQVCRAPLRGESWTDGPTSQRSRESSARAVAPAAIVARPQRGRVSVAGRSATGSREATAEFETSSTSKPARSTSCLSPAGVNAK